MYGIEAGHLLNTIEAPATSRAPDGEGQFFTSLSLLWLMALGAFFVARLIVAPGRGAGWAVDDGMFLANAWSFVRDGKLEGMLPQEPVYLANALWMKLGVRELLHFRYIYYGLSFLSAVVFFAGLDRRHFSSPLVPIAVAAALTVAFSSVLPFYFFFLFGAGCYFFSMNAAPWIRQLLLALSGVLLAVAGFMHAAFLIAMVLLVGFLLVLDKSVRRSPFAPCFALAVLVLWGFYIARLGAARFFDTPAGHDASLSHLLLKLKSIIWYFCSAALVYAIVAWVFFRLGRRRYAAAQMTIGVAITAYFAFTLFRSGTNVLNGSMRVNDLVRPMFEATAAVYEVLLLVFFRWAGELFHDAGSDGEPLRQRIKLVISQLQGSGEHRKLLTAVLGLFLIVSGYAAGSNSDYEICLSAYSAPALGTALILWGRFESGNWSIVIRTINGAMLVTWLLIFGAFAASVNLPTMTPIVSHGRVELQQSPLRGIDERPEYARVVVQLRELYQNNGCENLSLVMLDYVPMVYFILGHSLPDGFGIVRPSFYFPKENVVQALDLRKGWCALDVTTEETQAMVNSRGFDVREGVRKQIQEKSQKVFDLSSPSDGISSLRLYVRDAGTP